MQDQVEKQNKINSIINEIFKDHGLHDNDHFQDINSAESRNKIKNFISAAINGDDPEDWLIIPGNSDPSRETRVFILTNLRLIKIDIGKEIKSKSYLLDTIIGVERNLLRNGYIEFGISFQGGGVGLRYPAEEQKITDFFQKIEQPKMKSAHG